MRQDYTDPLMCALGNCCLAFLLSIFLLPETYKAASGDPSNQSTGIPKSDAIEGSPNDFCSRALKWGSICWKTVSCVVVLGLVCSLRMQFIFLCIYRINIWESTYAKWRL